MRITTITSSLLSSLLFTLPASAAATSSSSSSSSHQDTSTITTTLVLTIPASPNNHLPNPHALPPSTHATLTRLGRPTHRAPLTAANTFVFRNVTAGSSYLADVHCGTHVFAPLRVDVDVVSVPDAAAAVRAAVSSAGVAGAGAGSRMEEEEVEVVVKEEKDGAGVVTVKAWETYRGNDWGNKGEEVKPAASATGAFPVRVLGPKVFYTERGSFSIFGILKNPMILMGLVSMALFIGVPKLVDNMDPEMKAEFEEQQKKNPMNSLMGGSQAGASPMGNFDMAAFLAGQKKDDSESSGSNGGGGSSAGGSAKRGGKK
ncbi:hypothetical protein F4778DRAFT_777422 [Xylariomycetidae sp. FL2044]|nr:hypothetical protein F4778DRAFT_777422 [Xylariomycetidae sp. FL2044]